MQGIDRRRLAAELRHLARGSSIALAPQDMNFARATSGALWLFAALTIAVLLPFAPPTEGIGNVGWPLAIGGVLLAVWIAGRHLRTDVTLETIYLLGFAAVISVAALEWAAGGRDTPYHYLYLLPFLFAAGAQSLQRLRAFALVVAVVICAPLIYEGTEREIVLDIATQYATLLAMGLAVWLVFAILRTQSRMIRDQRTQAELLAREDELTGLGNRRAFGEALEREIARARRGDRGLSVVVGDLDNFKVINDRLGHAAGDESLRATADALRLVARNADACFRWGGDEFAILLPEADRAQAEGVAKRLRSAIREIVSPGDTPQLEITCGIAELNTEQDADALIAQADRELLERKRSGLSSG